MVKIFGREYSHLDPVFLQELRNLSDEGAIYAQFWREQSESFRTCRIRFQPEEIVAYVEALTAFDEFQAQCEIGRDSNRALEAVQSEQIRNRVREYNEWTRSAGQPETQFCAAAFMGEHLESLTCGGMPDRYEFLTESYTADRRFLLIELLEMLPEASVSLARRSGNRPPYAIESEQDVRDLAFALIKCVFPDARIEETTRQHAGSSKRVDIAIPAITTLIEVKYIRDRAHARRVADELRVDIESYYVHEHCKKLIAYVWDAEWLITDRQNFIRDLCGLRAKGAHSFEVEVLVKP